MKRIVILCDGTWNEPSSETPTNVVRIAQLMEPADSAEVVQVPIYVAGVGTGEGVTHFSRILDRYLGGAFGWGLYKNVVDAYRHLVFAYQPGDHIHIFGFSRGAFTARSLAGLIRATGIIPRDRLHLLPRAVKRYRDKSSKTTHPSTDESHRHRLEMSPDVVTSDEEQAWRREHGHRPGELLKIEFLGVWDSVGALGVPQAVPFVPKFWRKRYEFHDAALSSIVSSARHAVALDERRSTFEPTQWDNLDDLNEEAGKANDPDPPYQELFFVGDHGSVGGGGDITKLSAITLKWIIEGAEKAGLSFEEDRVALLDEEADVVHSPIHNRSNPKDGIMSKITKLLLKDRKGPKSFADTHPTVYERWAQIDYRPGSLARIEGELVAHQRAVSEGEAETAFA